MTCTATRPRGINKILNCVIMVAFFKHGKSVTISSNNVLRRFSTVHFRRKCFSSSISTLQNVNIRSLKDNLVCLPTSMFSLWSLFLNFESAFLCLKFNTTCRYYTIVVLLSVTMFSICTQFICCAHLDIIVEWCVVYALI